MRQDNVRLYKCPSGWTYETLQNFMTEQMRKIGLEEPQFIFNDAEYLDPEKINTLEDCNIEPDQLVIMDCKEVSRPWVIKNPYFPNEGKCE